MTNKKNVLVSDSFHTGTICAALSEIYSEKATVYGKEGDLAPGDWLAPTVQSAIAQESPPIPEEGKDQRFDLFFVSARLVLEGSINPSDLKKDHGTENAKIIVMSMLHSYLEQVKAKHPTVDFFLSKGDINKPHRMSKESKDLLLSYLDA